MATLTLGMGTSHMPGLNNPVEQWFTKAEADKRHLETHGLADYDDLARQRASWIGEEIKEEKIRERYAACQQAILTLQETLTRERPDVLLVVGDDHREVFSSEHMPSMNIHWADSMFVPPFPQNRNGRDMDGETHVYPGDTELAQHLLRSVTADQFDMSYSRTLSAEHGLGHAFDFVCRRIMNGAVVPQVPILVNTYYPPNRPTLKRCYEFGKALRRAVKCWDSDKRVAIIGTGGLTHHIVDERMDRAMLTAMERKAEDELTDFPEELFVDGTSEIKVWLVVAGAMAEGDLQMKLVNYSPCYRSPAGTGCGNAFAYWE